MRIYHPNNSFHYPEKLEIELLAFIGSLTCTLFEIIGTLGVICGLYEFISSTGSAASGWIVEFEGFFGKNIDYIK
jgi:hypothetical protein